jgi:hypothetical protein
LITALFATFLLLLAFCPQAYADIPITNLSNSSGIDETPDVNDDGWVVWRGHDGHDYEIYLKKPGGVPQKISNNDHNNDSEPSIDNYGNIVWRGYDGHDREIFLRRPGHPNLNVSNNDADDYRPRITMVPYSIFWLSHDGNDWELWGKEWQCGSAPRQLTNNTMDDKDLEVSPNGYVVWSGKRDNVSPCPACTISSYEILRYTPSFSCAVAEDNLSRSHFDDHAPQANNNGVVVWHGYPDDRSTTEVYAFAGLKYRLTDNNVDDQNAQINEGGQTVWTQGLGSSREIMTMNAWTPWPPVTNAYVNISNNAVEDNIDAQISDGGDVVWTGRNEAGGGEAVYWHTPGAGKITVTSGISYETPRISNNRHIVWQGYSFSDPYDIYDDMGGDNWVLMANPKSAAGNLEFGLMIGNAPMNLASYNNGVVAPGESIAPRHGSMGGPVRVNSATGDRAIVSQRTLWPKGGSSLEEVLGFEANRLSDHFWWTWYDQQSPGFKNWVLVSNPNSGSVYYEISIAGTLMGSGTIAPGENSNSSFPGAMGGPVEVKAWTDSSKSFTADVMASQRVLSNGDTAFNEQVGIPDSELSDRYVWTWYDNVEGRNWVLVANPHTAAGPVTYEIKLAGNVLQAGTLNPGEQVTPVFPGQVGGPFEVTASGRVIASQRIIWGPSFGETPGYPYSQLANNYHWTWYDEQSPGMRNWVLLANLSTTASSDYQVKVGGNVLASGTLAPGEQVTPTFPGTIGGPVEVITLGGQTIASQRVLYNGYFNEVLGTVLS